MVPKILVVKEDTSNPEIFGAVIVDIFVERQRSRL